MVDGPVPDGFVRITGHEPIDYWGSAPGPRASLIVGAAERALNALITESGSNVTLGTPDSLYETCLATQGRWSSAFAPTAGVYGSGAAPEAGTIMQRAFAQRTEAVKRLASLDVENAELLRLIGVQNAWIAELNAEKQRLEESNAWLTENNRHLADGPPTQHPPEYVAKVLMDREGRTDSYAHARLTEVIRCARLDGRKQARDEAKRLATFAPQKPADPPDPPRRADGTLAPQTRPWAPPNPAGDPRRIGG
jgi:hypothetical protein